MIKYRGTYRVYLAKNLLTGTSTENEYDSYIKGNKITIHRYNDNKLKIFFSTTGFANNRLKELTEAGVELTLYQDGDQESTYLFPETQLSIVVKILKVSSWGANKSPKVREKGNKRHLTEEEKDVLRERMVKARLTKKNAKEKDREKDENNG